MLPLITQPAVAPACYKPKWTKASSLVFSGSAHLARAGVAGSRTVATYEFALQITRPGQTNETIHCIGPDGQNLLAISLGAGRIRIGEQVAGAWNWRYETAALYRDVVGFLHGVIHLDTDAASGQRVALTVNGRPVSVWAVSSDPGAGRLLPIGTTQSHRIGNEFSFPFGGLLSWFRYINGTKVPASRFGEWNIHGEWVLVDPALTQAEYGAGGYCLDFEDPLQPGKDVSGNGLHFTPTGIDATGKDRVASSPSKVVAAFTQLDATNTAAVQNGGWRIKSPGANVRVRASMALRNPTYWERAVTALAGDNNFGISRADITITEAVYNHPSTLYYEATGAVRVGGVVQATIATFTTGDVIGYAFDPATCILGLFKNGVFLAQYQAPTGYEYAPWVQTSSNSASIDDINFGQRPWAFPAPEGYSALDTNEAAEPQIKDPAEATVGASGTGATLQALLDAAADWGGAGYLELAKSRGSSGDWVLRNTVRGLDKAIKTNNPATGETAFAGHAGADAWWGRRWRLGQKFGCMVSFHAKGVAGNQAVAHGLGRAPGMVWAINLAGGELYGYHQALGAGAWLRMGGANAAPKTSDNTVWGGVAPTTSEITLGSAFPNGAQVLVIAWAEIAGYSHFGRFVGNGLADGAQAPSDVQPDIHMVWRTDAAQNVYLFDRVINPTNPATKAMVLNQTYAETANGNQVDLVTGGTKARTSGSSSTNNANSEHLTAHWGRPIGGICTAPATAR